MNLGALLDELRAGILHDYSDQISGASDYLWSDTRLVRYIDEAQQRFARQALVIRDGALKISGATAAYGTLTPVTQVTLATGVGIYALDPVVIAVISAQLTGDTGDLARAGHSAFQQYSTPDPYFFDPAQLASLPPGKPVAFGTDEFMNADPEGTLSVINFRVFPVPSSAYNAQKINLRVIRLPLVRFQLQDLDAEPEVPEHHHMDMLDWAAYLALRIVDTDGGFTDRANEFRASFEKHVEEARKVALRKVFTPQQWQFGRGGWAWVGN